MSKFTPGPWESNFEQKDICFVNSDNRGICSLPMEDDKDDDILKYIGEIQANTILIAKAPEMYDMIEELRKVLITIYNANEDAPEYESVMLDKYLEAIIKLQEEIE